MSPKPNCLHIPVRPLLTSFVGVITFLHAGQGICAVETPPSQPGIEPEMLLPPESRPEPPRGDPLPRLAAQEAAAPPVASRWYGYQLMLTDAASFAVGLGISSALDGHFEYHEWVATMPFLVAPSIVHGLHRRPVQAVLSPVMRLGFPLMGAAIGRSIESCEPGGWLCGVKGTVIGGGVGLLTALVVDYSIARAPAATVATTSDADRSTAKAHGPLVSIIAAGVAPTAKGGASLVLGGSF